MADLALGSQAPDFVSQGVDTARLRSEAPLVVVIWRTGCSTCRLAIPYYQRLQEKFPEANVVGVCQETKDVTADYCRQNGLTFKQVADEDDGLPVSRLFGPEAVPSYVLTDESGRVLAGGEGWSADALNSIGSQIGAALGVERGDVVPAGEPVPRLKPG
ncbi:MAG: TlpA family protein disulfide reductase [Armatimonadetes bacterium]|nr:TlpA family protein disulfide reductase [Armatimonadota bacterium]